MSERKTTFRLSWEMVNLGSLWKYSNADPRDFKNTTQVVPNSLIPDDDWHPVSRDAASLDDVADQFKTLKSWADANTGFVRNVTLVEVLTSEETKLVDPAVLS